MRIALIISIVLKITSLIECQVVLTRELLEQWYGDNLAIEEDLELDSREVVSIDPQTFNGLTNVKILHLNDNEITPIDQETFIGLTNLQTLYLHYNQISSIDVKRVDESSRTILI